MASYGITRLLWCYLAILLTFGQVLYAKPPDLPAEIPPSGDSLQIRLDYNLFKRQSVLFSSHLEFTEAPKISNRQLRTLAVEAYKEMEEMLKNYKFGNTKKPNTMTTLLVDKEVIFASSAKGKANPIPEGSQVLEDLAACGPGSHKFGGKCGEVMAFDEYYKSNVDASKLGKDSGARIVAISRQRDAEGVYQYSILAPCGDEVDWGCNRLVKDLNVLDDEKVAADPETTDFDWRQLKKDKKLGIKQSPAVEQTQGPRGSEASPSKDTDGVENPCPKGSLKTKRGCTPVEEPIDEKDAAAIPDKEKAADLIKSASEKEFSELADYRGLTDLAKQKLLQIKVLFASNFLGLFNDIKALIL